MSRGGSRASSARFETVSIPVYAIIAIGIARKKSAHDGATPQWMFDEKTTCGSKINTKPITTRRSCVAKSTTARRMLRFAASLMPTMLSRTRTTITRTPPTMSQGFSRSGSQKIER